MVLFKGRSKFKQNKPPKPKKWDYKFYILKSPAGLFFKSEVHAATIDVLPGKPDLHVSGYIVI